ncbi:hypothetical protein Taro_037823 [Colocasia esculenta]|uniref:Uncharacterized protein n=1 Tax=Colocasia esculenta TaxID=4460 RepID=A0A843WC39_COLES|nr:hypothetical protein [Colocasia esculenta]
MAEQFFRAMYQGAWQPGQAVAGGQLSVPPPVVLEQQAEPEVEQPKCQQRSGTRSAWVRQRRRTVTEDRTALLERFFHLRPPMFSCEYDLDNVESWTHELERTFETMEGAEEDQPCGGHDEQSYGISDRFVFPYRASCCFASTLLVVGETSQQQQGARRADETGR